jgi:hypothetical protein
MARTGFRSRFMLGGRNTTPSGRRLLTLFGLIFGLSLAVGGTVAGLRGLREVLDPSATMYRLRRVSGAAQASGVVRYAERVRALDDGRPPLCEVVHEHYVSGKNGGWRVDTRWTRSAGATLDNNARIVAGEALRFDPLDLLVVPDDDEAWFRGVLADVPPGGRLRAHCVAPGQPVFFEGCATPTGALGACNGVPLTITTGDGTAQPRIDAHASAVAGELTGGAAALVLALAYLWWIVRARPLAEALLRRAGPVPTFAAWPLVLGVGGGALLAIIAQGVVVSSAPAGSALSRGRPGYLIGLVVCAVATILAVVVRHRRQSLERAMAPVREAETVPLRDARGGVVELAVRVRDDGAPVTGVLDARPHAWVDVRVEETCAQGKQQITRLAARKYWPARIPVKDASGDGLVDPTHVELDLRSTVKVFKQGDALGEALARTPIGKLKPGAAHLHWTVEESVLDPGESLYVLGQCRRIEDPKAAGSYRADSTMAVVGGDPEQRLIVHAGDERSLLRSLGRERTYLDLLTAALLGTAASLALTMLALWSL